MKWVIDLADQYVHFIDDEIYILKSAMGLMLLQGSMCRKITYECWYTIM